ncbi:tryptophan synthase alpha chain [Pseudoclavibacter endophyticus]|uniref:Tryptophan synthase alpha chain n=1 Tax=Pseudoclavibacter endophyticus TaxID=1778590 RepID=A0A6H9WPQ6_9MICO|nr:tryptophan synthase subunit alpha [Pseudoclavibacter endophyticus]KAB1650108.1 tryptophan synthase subunit alpha [Pseudoclavibacter endophyticus]GGA57172.1 tryptophan synthase alpha chain [Pseudoclavibacter endophyticus]
MSAVERAIDAALAERKGALIGYLPVGFPSLDESVEAACAILDGGMDVLEFGLPYSDPVMDGPVIQSATVQALENGFRVADVFEATRRVTERTGKPVLVMSYWNLVLQYGVEAFARDLAAAGGAGLVTPDLIPDEAADWLAASETHGLDRVFLAAPTSSDERLGTVIERSRGFVYTVSTMGITGARDDVDRAARVLADRLHGLGCARACVGLGISTPQQVADVLEYAEGAIVGSALVRALTDGGVERVRGLASDLAAGARASRSR